MKLTKIIAVALLFTAVNAFAGAFTDEEKATSFSAKQVETMPVPVSQSKPDLAASLKGVEGKVFIGFIVNAQGDVEAVRVIKSENELLNDTAMQCVSNWKFTAAVKDGNNVPVRVIVPIRFG